MDIILECPNCKDLFIVTNKDINCAIFRHAVYKHNMEPIDPHSTKIKCETLINQNLIYGCSKPFKLVFTDNKYSAEICDYI